MNPLIALDKMRGFRPHVIVLDLEMPEMDGLTFLRRVMATDPIPGAVCSGPAARGTEAAFATIEASAPGGIGKPRVGLKSVFHASPVMLPDPAVSTAPAPP